MEGALGVGSIGLTDHYTNESCLKSKKCWPRVMEKAIMSIGTGRDVL